MGLPVAYKVTSAHYIPKGEHQHLWLISQWARPHLKRCVQVWVP